MHMRLALLMCLVLATLPLFAQNGGSLRGKVLVVEHSDHSTAAGDRGPRSRIHRIARGIREVGP